MKTLLFSFAILVSFTVFSQDKPVFTEASAQKYISVIDSMSKAYPNNKRIYVDIVYGNHCNNKQFVSDLSDYLYQKYSVDNKGFVSDVPIQMNDLKTKSGISYRCSPYYHLQPNEMNNLPKGEEIFIRFEIGNL